VVVWVVAGVLTTPVAQAWQAKSSEPVEMAQFQVEPAPKIALRAALYLPPETCTYKFRYMLGLYNAGASACPRVIQQIQMAFNDVVRIDQLAGTHSDVDIVIAVQKPAGRLWQSGLVHGSSSMALDFAAYSPNAAPILASTELSAMKGLMSNGDIRSSFGELAANDTSRFLQRLKATPFVVAALRPPPPKLVPPPPPQPATIEISSGSAVQVYVDDEFKGTTSSDGHLVVTLQPGAHRLRLSQPGKKEWTEPLQLLAGERHPIIAQLESTGPKPLSENDIEEALSNGLSKARVLALVKQYGVSFALNDATEQRLRAAGADDEVLLAIVKNKK